MLVERLLFKQINMSVISGVFFVVSLFAMAYAYVPVRPMSMSSTAWYGPRYDSSCRESIEDLKALIDVTQSLKHVNNNYTCETCARTFNEEVILKLINALIITATRNCAHPDEHHKPYASNNIGVWNAGGGYMGGNTIVVGGPVTSGGPGGVGATNTREGTGNETNSIDEALIRLGILDGENTVGLGVGNTEILNTNAANIGRKATNKSSENKAVDKDDSLVNLGVLDGNNTLGLKVGGNEIVAANVHNIVGGKNTTNDSKDASSIPNDGKPVPTTGASPVVPVASTPVSPVTHNASTPANSIDKVA